MSFRSGRATQETLKKTKRSVIGQAVVAPAFNPSTWEAEAGGISEFEASLVYRVPGQPGLYRETLSWKKKKKKKKTSPEKTETCSNHWSAIVAQSVSSSQ